MAHPLLIKLLMHWFCFIGLIIGLPISFLFFSLMFSSPSPSRTNMLAFLFKKSAHPFLYDASYKNSSFCGKIGWKSLNLFALNVAQPQDEAECFDHTYVHMIVRSGHFENEAKRPYHTNVWMDSWNFRSNFSIIIP